MTDLPETALELIELIGLADTLALVEWRPGRVVYIAERPLADHEIVQVIGLEKARILAKHYGHDRLTIPMCKAALRAKRDAEIYRLHYDHGKSIDQLAGEHGLHWTTICRAVRRHKARRNEPDPQHDLFG